MAIARNTICLWFDKEAEAAARFYTETFPNSTMGAVHRAPTDYPSGKAGDVLTVEFHRRRHPLHRAERRPHLHAQRGFLVPDRH